MESEPDQLYALAVLANRQGVFTGDLNRLQRSLLSFLIGREAEDRVEQMRQQFKMQMIAAHPDKADKLLAMFDDNEELPEALEDEDFEDLGPLPADQVEQAISDLRTLGIAITDS